MAPDRLDTRSLLMLLQGLALQGGADATSSRLAELSGASPATVKRLLDRLLSEGRILREGKARATRYWPADIPRAPSPRALPSMQPRDFAYPLHVASPEPPSLAPVWSTRSRRLLRVLDRPLAARKPVSYFRAFVEKYKPNASSLLPPRLAAELDETGRMRGQQPAGTYARKVLEQLLIDLSWSSSRLEGNRYTRLDTEELFRKGAAGGDTDAIMLLDHKSAIEFMVDTVPLQGLTSRVVRNIHALLMQDLLTDSASLGRIREKVVYITGTTYIPSQVPAVLAEMFDLILEKARLVKSPAEAAFFLWVNLAYLQPFDDGNKRVSRLAANIPLMLYNRAPLAFLDVTVDMYANAMIGVYEFRDVSLAIDLFEWTYRRSKMKYEAVLEAVGSPDPTRVRYREALNDAMGRVVRERQRLKPALAGMNATEKSMPGFKALLVDELDKLEPFNCARYRLAANAVEDWIAAGRPR